MTSSMGRAETLRDLVELRGSVSDALMRLSKFEWSYEQDLITLTTKDVGRALDGFDAGLLDEADLCAWAEAVQGREDVALDPADREVLAQALFELSTPELFGTLAEIVESTRGRMR